MKLIVKTYDSEDNLTGNQETLCVDLLAYRNTKEKHKNLYEKLLIELKNSNPSLPTSTYHQA